MSWDTEKIYTLPDPAVIDFFKRIPDHEYMGIYLVNDLEGIRSEYSRNNIFSDTPTEKSYLRHGLPDKGLLAVLTNFGADFRSSDNEPDKFWKEIPDGYEDIANSNEPVDGLPATLGINDTQVKLFRVLKELNAKTRVPFMYYKCTMWGGLVDEEYAVVFDGDLFIYWKDYDTNKYYQSKHNEVSEIQTTALQKGLEHLGLPLPTHYFALHERDFNWGRYGVRGSSRD